MIYRPEIDGLRAVAVLAVIFSHVGMEAFAGGFVGVDVFFVISGYLIASITMRDIDAGKFSLLHFYERRAKRILPALFFVLLWSFALFWFVLPPEEFKRYSNSLIAATLSVSNFYFLNSIDYFAPAASETPLLHTWSLAVEEQFYLLFPMLLICVRGIEKRILTLASLALVSFVLCAIGAQYFPSQSYYLLPTRAWEMLAGAMLALYMYVRPVSSRPALAPLGLVLIVASVLYFDEGSLYPSAYTLIPVVGAALFIAYASAGGFIGWLTANPLAVWIGKISFSAYLWHQVVFVFWRMSGHDVSSLTTQLALIAIVMVCALTTYFVVERPLRYVRITRITVARSVCAVGAICVGLGAWGAIGKGLPFRMPEEYIQFHSTIKWSRNCLIPVEKPEFELPAKGCVAGAADAPLKIALWGDSVSAAMAPTVMELFPSNGVQFTQLFYSACAPVDGVYTAARELTRYCGDVVKRGLEYLLNHEFDAVILGAAWVEFFGSASHFIDGIQVGDDPAKVKQIRDKFDRTVEQLLNDGKIVILMDPVAMVRFKPADRMAKKVMVQGRSALVTISLEEFDENTARAREGLTISQRPNFYRVNPADAFCRDQCYLGEGGKTYFADPVHYTREGAELVGGVLLPVLVRAGLINASLN